MTSADLRRLISESWTVGACSSSGVTSLQNPTQGNPPRDLMKPKDTMKVLKCALRFESLQSAAYWCSSLNVARKMKWTYVFRRFFIASMSWFVTSHLLCVNAEATSNLCWGTQCWGTQRYDYQSKNAKDHSSSGRKHGMRNRRPFSRDFFFSRAQRCVYSVLKTHSG